MPLPYVQRGGDEMVCDPVRDLRDTVDGRKFQTILADPPWRFMNRTGKMAPEHRRLSRYGTLGLAEIKGLPVAELVQEPRAPVPLGSKCPATGWHRSPESVGVRIQV